MSQPPDPTRRKIAAKRFNENLKLLATSLNTIGLTTVGVAFIIPSVTGTQSVNVFWIVMAFILHILAQLVLRLLRSED